MKRRAWLAAALAAWARSVTSATSATSAGATVRRGQALVFPRDHGAHLEARTEWWYATGWLGTEAEPRWGFQLTFFRSRTGMAEELPGRFAARQLLFGHAAVSDLAQRRHRHTQRIARWSGLANSALGAASQVDGDVRLGRWSLRREGGGWLASLPAEDFTLELTLQPTQPLLLQGDAGFSRKGPEESQASHYYSEPQLAVRGALSLDGRRVEASGRGWLDREWSDHYLAGDAVGWDWIGINLFDGSTLMAFRIRHPDGSALWAGGSWRAPDRTSIDFGPGDVTFTPGRRWTSPASQASYPMEWQIETAHAGRFALRSLMDAQELDSRGSTGAIYWEGLAELLDGGGRRVGLGYLEMTGYAARLRMQ
jgi:predicted secreted hydrolase